MTTAAAASTDSQSPGQSQAGVRRVAVVGSPNSGKTTLFNAITGLRRKVANYPGVTVDYVEGRHSKHRDLMLIDLPGTYSLEPLSPDEAVTSDVLAGAIDDLRAPDAALIVADSTTLRRSLGLVAEVMELGLPSLLVLTMSDELKARHGAVDLVGLSGALGIPVVAVVGNRGLGLDQLESHLEDPLSWPVPPGPSELETPSLLNLDGEEASLGDTDLIGDGAEHAPLRVGENDLVAPSLDLEAVARRLAWADALYDNFVTPPREAVTLTDKVDRVLLHPVWGMAVFGLTMLVFFQVVFTVAAPLQEGMEGGVGWLGVQLATTLPDGLFKALLVDGIIAGVGSVVVFLPQIALLLLMVRLMEGVGYMARAAFLVDRVMGWAGLEGRSFVALLSSFACAVPGVMATRGIPDPKSRLATILVAPFMTCSARLPVYGLLIGAFIPATMVGGIFQLQGLVLFGLYLLGALTALAAGALLKRWVVPGNPFPYMMELPPYRMPTLKVLGQQVWGGVYAFLRKAGTIILAVSILLWVLMTFPEAEIPEELAEDEAAAAAYQLEQSYAADIGKAIEPVIEPLGFDWRIGVGIVASFAAREVIVATMGQIFAFGGEEDDLDGLGDRLKAHKDPSTGELAYTIPVALSLLVFFVFALQCVSTLAVMRRETNGLRWPAFAFGYMLVIAWIASFATYQVSSIWL